jgi:general secretion pathway protein I
VTLLARSKMIDIEQKLADEGFMMGESRDEGDFREESHEEIKWSSTVSEVEIDLGGLSSLCEGLEGDAGGGGCESMLSGLSGGPLTSFTEEIGRSLRVINLTLTWPEGKFSSSMTVRALVTREDFALTPEQAALQQAVDAAASGGTVVPPKGGN